MSEFTIAIIPVDCVEAAWPRASVFIKMATDLSHGEASTDTVKERCLSGDAILLTVFKGTEMYGAITGEVRTFDTGVSALFWPIVGGKDMELWFDEMYHAMLEVAKASGCDEMRGIAVRNGWLRRLKSLGWEEVSTSVRCPIIKEVS
jgi:hypothetical protein